MTAYSANVNALVRLFFFNDTATTEIYTLSLHDALPISVLFSARSEAGLVVAMGDEVVEALTLMQRQRFDEDRKSTRLNPVTIRYRMPSSACKKKKDTCFGLT